MSTNHKKDERNYINSIKLLYKVDKNKDFINLFGFDFVKNNKSKCKMIIDKKEYELQKEFN